MTMGSIRSRAIRSAVAGFAAGSAIVALQNAGAQGVAHDTNSPVNYAADRIELQDRQNRVILAGNVDITQGGMRMRAARTTVAYTNEGSLKIQRIDATGGVFVTRNNESAKGDVAIYDFNRRVITMVGNVGLKRGSDTLNGGRLVMDLNSGITSVDGRGGGASGAGGGRVSGSFSVPKRD
jgi:lipopolysaccharide export system protein LptA